MLEPIIKGCPFCGKEPNYVEGYDNETMKYAAAIVCTNAFCSVNPEVVRLDEFRYRMQTKERVIEAWNKRARI